MFTETPIQLLRVTVDGDDADPSHTVDFLVIDGWYVNRDDGSLYATQEEAIAYGEYLLRDET